jgi:hypothetical protein
MTLNIHETEIAKAMMIRTQLKITDNLNVIKLSDLHHQANDFLARDLNSVSSESLVSKPMKAPFVPSTVLLKCLVIFTIL